jgi:hypothetical protein
MRTGCHADPHRTTLSYEVVARPNVPSPSGQRNVVAQSIQCCPRSGVEDRNLTAVAEVLGMAKEVDDDHVLAAAADVAVPAGSADQHVVIGSAHQPIIPGPSAQDVVAFSSADAVRRGGSADAVGAGGAVDLVQPGGDRRGGQHERDEQERGDQAGGRGPPPIAQGSLGAIRRWNDSLARLVLGHSLDIPPRRVLTQ